MTSFNHDVYTPVSPSQLYDTQDFEIDDEYKPPPARRAYSQAEATQSSSVSSQSTVDGSQRKSMRMQRTGAKPAPSPLFAKPSDLKAIPSPTRVNGQSYGSFVKTIKVNAQDLL
jgi:hypothetical protein